MNKQYYIEFAKNVLAETKTPGTIEACFTLMVNLKQSEAATVLVEDEKMITSILNVPCHPNGHFLVIEMWKLKNRKICTAILKKDHVYGLEIKELVDLNHPIFTEKWIDCLKLLRKYLTNHRNSNQYTSTIDRIDLLLN